ncbi:hypothetical protein DFP74_4114 [Nocardiopsis sp. Huas11]|uniref:hypothetical protein n=1 Tax=Nocardiopsis sp. Huas11 TaxID=2183912 RepID=UPI000F25AB9D|nr:hypothetical protein [Nocardiopsis sp. Huas11]RKS08417.1 hypothetical protein DFP74_4114 [Nocardiopsis sp. Huas11]
MTDTKTAFSISTPSPSYWAPVDLRAHVDNRGISPADESAAGAFNIWGNSFPSEHLPRAGSRVEVEGVPFEFPVSSDNGDNVQCAGQLVSVPVERYDWIYVLAAAERRAEDEAALHFTDGWVDFEPLRVSDFWAAPSVFGEVSAYRTPVMHYPHHVQPGVQAALWCQRLPVVRRAALTSIRLPRNNAVHVFAMTAVGRGEPGASGVRGRG